MTALILQPMPFQLTLHRPFVADHFHDLPGFVEARHGHNWELEATAELASEAEEAAFSEALDAWIAGVDYHLLNALPECAGRNPTAELLAWRALEHLLDAGLEARSVKIREKANYWALCRPGTGR